MHSTLSKNKGTLAMGFSLAVLFAVIALIPKPAFAVTVIDLVNYGPLTFFQIFLCELMSNLVIDFLSPMTQVVFDWSTDYTTIPGVNRIILGLQGLAVIGVVAIRVGKGISSGILLSGGNREQSLGEYIYRTVIALAIVALMPTLCALVIQFGTTLYGDVVAQGGTIADSLKWFSLDSVQNEDGTYTFEESLDGSTANSFFWLIVGCLLIVILCVAVGYQFVRRQIEMLVISIAGPIVAIYTATDDDAGQTWDLLKKLFGLCCMQWMQYILVEIAMAFGIAWASAVGVDGGAAQVFSDGEGAKMFLFCIATFGAALTLPSLLDQFVMGNGGGSRIGGVVVGAMVTKSIGAGGKAAGGAARSVGQGAKTVMKR